eukprot:7271887-Pyramimonas_sp.AAC.2
MDQSSGHSEAHLARHGLTLRVGHLRLLPLSRQGGVLQQVPDVLEAQSNDGVHRLPHGLLRATAAATAATPLLARNHLLGRGECYMGCYMGGYCRGRNMGCYMRCYKGGEEGGRERRTKGVGNEG